MPRFAANLTTMFTEFAFLDRFEAAAAAGFGAVEFLFPYEHSAAAIGDRLRRHGLTQALFNLPPGDWLAGERGMAALPGRQRDVADALSQALPYIESTGVKRVHLMAGIVPRGPRADQAFAHSVRTCAQALAALGVELMLEPLNRRDVPGYYLDDFDFAADFIRRLDVENVKLQFDVYHCQILHGDVTERLRALMPIVGHVQVASVPSRQEPDGEELNYPFLFAEFDRLGYTGFIGGEYRPRGRTVDGLGWFAPWRPAASGRPR